MGKWKSGCSRLQSSLRSRSFWTNIHMRYQEDRNSVRQLPRALVTKPQLLLADEPTGALDSRASKALLDLFTGINEDGQTIVMVTHSVRAASTAKRVLFIKDGEVFHQLYRGNLSEDEMYQKISDTLSVLATGGEHIG